MWLAVLPYALKNYDNTSNWFRTLSTQMTKFPLIAGIYPTSDMGIPDWLACRTALDGRAKASPSPSHPHLLKISRRNSWTPNTTTFTLLASSESGVEGNLARQSRRSLSRVTALFRRGT